MQPGQSGRARGALIAAAALMCLAACGGATATPTRARNAEGPDRATRIKHGILSPVDVDEALTAPCNDDHQRMMRGLAYFHAVGKGAYPGHAALVDLIVRCANTRTAAGEALAVVELTRSGLTYEPKDEALLEAHGRARQAISVPLFERAEGQRRAGRKSAELYDLALAQFVWPERQGAAARIEELAQELERGSTFTVFLDITVDASGASLGHRELPGIVAERTRSRFVRVEASGARPVKAAADGVRITARLERHRVTRGPDDCSERSANERLGGEVVIVLRGSRLSDGADLDITQTRVLAIQSDCVEGPANVAGARAGIREQVANHLAILVSAAYEARRARYLEDAVASAAAGRIDEAIDHYVLFALHHDGTPIGSTQRWALEKQFHESRGFDGQKLAMIDGFFDRFRAVRARTVDGQGETIAAPDR